LFGHPLTNALITATAAIAVLKMPWLFITKSCVAGLMVLSLLTFGGRGSLGAWLTGLVLYFMSAPFLNITTTFNEKLGKLLALYVGLIAVTAVLGYVIFGTEIGRPIASRLMMDDSIESRFNSLSVVNSFGHSELLWGQALGSFESSVEKSGIVTVVENFWVVLLLRSGLPVFVVFVASLFYLLYQMIKQGNWIDGIITLVFLLAASTNNSLSTKSTSPCRVFHTGYRHSEYRESFGWKSRELK